ncbi:GNAT family N-acetyltransferase [Luminiphilus syltensis]|uniref:GNAT family N-acetyltransferase n=1 Tax=Luminiphilus syltensis TaxID=1341119 RepID=UPI00058EA07D|nr:GNAT family N-acetyltransferase [Luminiphilus syltensis]
MTSLPTIRKAKPNEIEELTGLALRSKAYWGYSQSFMEACRDELTVTERSLNSVDLHYYVAEKESELLEYYAIEKLNDQEFELEALFVEPVFIGKGVGRALIDHAKNLVRELGGKTLIIQGDPNAEKLYRAPGGKPNGTRESASIPVRELPFFTVDLSRSYVSD